MTPNTPQEVLALARKIAADTVTESDCLLRDKYLDGRYDRIHIVKSAIAAIMEVTERAAKSIENRGDCDAYPWGSYFADELRNMEHLK